MTPNSWLFHGFLRAELRDFRDFKLGLGFTSYRKPSIARDFDHYIIFRDITRVGDIDEQFISNWIHAVPENLPGTKNHKLKFARKFFEYLMRRGLAHDNPARRIPYLKVKPYRSYIYTLKELEQIFARARRFTRPYYTRCLGPMLATMLFLIYACGLRLGEAIKLNIDDVDFEQNTLSLWKTKFHKERIVPFSAAVAEILKSYLAGRKRLFPVGPTKAPFFCNRTGERYRGKSIETHFHRVLSQCGLTRAAGGKSPRIHDLRHTFAVHRLYKWYQEGCDILNKLPLLSTYMGHTHLNHTQVYLAVTKALLREGDRKFQAGFEPLAQKALDRVFKRS